MTNGCRRDTKLALTLQKNATRTNMTIASRPTSTLEPGWATYHSSSILTHESPWVIKHTWHRARPKSCTKQNTITMIIDTSEALRTPDARTWDQRCAGNYYKEKQSRAQRELEIDKRKKAWNTNKEHKQYKERTDNSRRRFFQINQYQLKS